MNKLLSVLLVALSLASCSDFLDKQPDDQLTLDMVFRDKTRTEDWLAGVYSQIPTLWDDYNREIDPLADDLAPSPGWEPWWGIVAKQKGDWNTTSGWGPNFFIELPKRIRSAYIFIDNVRANEAQLVTQQEVTYMKAEARFMIAYYYYLMANFYGAVPLQLGLANINASTDEFMTGQTPYDEVIDWVNNELLEVSKILPASYTDARKYGRATSIMCLAVRARMLLFAASPLVNGNAAYKGFVNNEGKELFNTVYDASKWTRAAQACKELIDAAHANGHALYCEYLGDGTTIDPFLSYQNMMFRREVDGNREILFARPENNWGEYNKHAFPRGAGGNGGLGVTQSLVDAFFMKDGLPIGQSPLYSESGFSTEDEKRATRWMEVNGNSNNNENTVTMAETHNMYCNREPRFYISILYNNVWHRASNNRINFYSGQKDGGPGHDAPQFGYLVRKLVHPDYNQRNNVNPYHPGILFRLGEAYLNYIEALNESDPGNSEILQYLNLIRVRAGIPAFGAGEGQIAPPASQDEMRQAIYRERRVELNCEAGIRYDDVRRLMIGESLLNKTMEGLNYLGGDANTFFVRTPVQARVFTAKNYWIPIPQSEIDKNPNLRQLPGW